MVLLRRLTPPVVLAGYATLFLLFDLTARAFEVAPGVSAWYASAGLNLALIVLFGAMYTPAIFVATMASGLMISDPPIPFVHLVGPTLVICLAQALAGTWLRNRWLALLDEDSHEAVALQFVSPFLLVCALLPFAIAIPSIASYYATGLHGYTLEQLPTILMSWWLGDVVGLLTVTPLLVLLMSPHFHGRISGSELRASFDRGQFRSALAEYTALSIAVIGALLLASPQSNLYFLIYLPVLWISLQRGLIRSAVAVFVTNMLAALGMVLLRPEASIAHLQLFMITLALCGLIVGALVSERHWTIGRMKSAIASLRIAAADSCPSDDCSGCSPSAHDSDADSLARHVQTLESVHELLKDSASRLRSLNAEKDRLLSILSHDLRSPLAGIKGLAEVLIEESDEREPLERDMLESIRDSAHQCHRLMENLLHWAQIQTGAHKAGRIRVDVSRMIRTSAALAASSAQGKSISIETHLPERLTVMADPEMTGTIIRNLLSNAVKFTPSGGRVSVKASLIGDVVQVIVRDTGVGMDDQRLDALFHIGSKTSTPGTAGERGTGLGLILCRDLAEQQGGSLSIRSIPADGTIVTLALPAATALQSLEGSPDRAGIR